MYPQIAFGSVPLHVWIQLFQMFNMILMYFCPQEILRTKKQERKQHSEQTHDTLVHNHCKKLKRKHTLF